MMNILFQNHIIFLFSIYQKRFPSQSYHNNFLVSYDEENPDDEKSEVEAYDAEINEIVPDDLGEEVELSEEDDEEEDAEDEEEE